MKPTSDPKKTNPIKPNSKPIQSQFQKRPKMNVNKVLAKEYENIRLHRRPENKPNSNPISKGKKTLTRQLPLSASWHSDTFNSVRYNYDTFAFDLVAFLFGFLFMVLSDSGRL